jgi:uncharacterized phage protein (TIGR01671 family)
MNREIKFRAWDESCNKMRGLDGVKDCFGMRSDGKTNDDFILMQFTGLKDKNGKDIYEGDIVEDKELGRGIVVFQIGCFFMMYDADTNMEFLGLKSDEFGRLQKKRIVEVIGNIYEHKNLLENEK